MVCPTDTGMAVPVAVAVIRAQLVLKPLPACILVTVTVTVFNGDKAGSLRLYSGELEVLPSIWFPLLSIWINC
jgi:hypothetical protein